MFLNSKVRKKKLHINAIFIWYYFQCLKDGLQDGEDKLVIECAEWEAAENSVPQLWMSMWREIPNSPNSEFYGEVCVNLDSSVFSSGPQWFVDK